MKIAILTSGILPVPAVQGGAVENLIDFYLEYNNQKKLHDITVYSTNHPNTHNHPALLSEANHYHYIDTTSFIAKIRRSVYRLFHKNEYYNYFIEYYFEQAYKHLKKRTFDCIILENRPGYAYKLSKRGYNHIILHLHNDLLNASTPLNYTIYNSLSKIITVSNYIQKRVSTIIQSNKNQTIYNGIDLNLFSRKASSPIKREILGFSENDFVIVFSGRINKEKGLSELLDAMLQLKNIPQIKLMILGSTFFKDANNDSIFVQSLKNKVSPIANNIVFTGFIQYSKLADYLHIADIAVLPSMWEEPFGLTIVETMAVDLPLITTRSGGIPEICEGVACIVDRKNIVENLTSSILDLYHHPEKRRIMAIASHERSKQFDKETYASNFINALE